MNQVMQVSSFDVRVQGSTDRSLNQVMPNFDLEWVKPGLASWLFIWLSQSVAPLMAAANGKASSFISSIWNFLTCNFLCW